jgi:putative resolvase
MSEYVSIKEASRLTGLHENTLHRLGDEQKISCYKTPSEQRRFNKHYLEKMCNPIFINKESTKTNFIYTRISSKKQLDDLSRQIAYIQSSDSSYTTLSDIGSGINFKCKGLQILLDACL